MDDTVCIIYCNLIINFKTAVLVTQNDYVVRIFYSCLKTCRRNMQTSNRLHSTVILSASGSCPLRTPAPHDRARVASAGGAEALPGRSRSLPVVSVPDVGG